MSLYLKFKAYAEEHKLPVDLTAERLLEIISYCASNEALTVTECMELHEVASPATLHRKLDELREAGLIFQQYEGNNRRTKYLYPTQKALNHFSKLTDAMRLAIGDSL